MFKHLLIPTDGSDLSRKAVLYGVQLAKECGAKVTALTLAEPYHVASMDAVLVSVGEDEYEEEFAPPRQTGARAGEHSGRCGGGALRHDPRGARSAVSRHHRRGSRQGLRSDRDGVAWPAGHVSAAARQRDGQGSHPLDHSGAGLPMTQSQSVSFVFRRRSALSARLPAAQSASATATPPALNSRPAAFASSTRSSRSMASASRPDDEPRLPTASSPSRTGVPGAAGVGQHLDARDPLAGGPAMFHARDDLLADIAALFEIDAVEEVEVRVVRKRVAIDEIDAALRDAGADAQAPRTALAVPVADRDRLRARQNRAPAEAGIARVGVDDDARRIFRRARPRRRRRASSALSSAITTLARSL